MDARCPHCQTVFRIDPAKVPAAGVRARCNVCSGVFFVGAEAPTTQRVAAPPPSMPPPPPPRRSAVAAAPPPPPAVARSAAPPAAAPMPGFVSPRATPFQAPPAERAAPPIPAPTPPPPPPRTAGSGLHAPAPPTGRPVNPFLAQDPGTKARRLARALISDLVVYHPAKRADGLRDGSLKILFEEEIRKCWEEFTDQVGMEMATTTPYFTEALNEILADGRTVFP